MHIFFCCVWDMHSVQVAIRPVMPSTRPAESVNSMHKGHSGLNVQACLDQAGLTCTAQQYS